MAKEIAVVIGSGGTTVSLLDSGKVIVYRKATGEWQSIREKPFMLDPSTGLRGMRQTMSEVIAFLDKCNVFIASSVSGMPYFELEKALINIWEFEGQPEEFLEYVSTKEEELQQEQEQVKQVVIPVPVETENGIFRVSIKDIQESNSGITSKQVLQPFLRQGKFYSLEVTCSHIPPWLEGELMQECYQAVTEKTASNEMRVTITKKCCDE